MLIDEELQRLLSEARAVSVLTGAGISAESGVPTFRGGGQSAVWKGMPFDEISSARMVRENLLEVWEWFDYRRGVLRDCQPNDGHRVLADWQDVFPEFSLVTQNIDGLHAAAGSRDVIELHGNIHRARCESCGVAVDIRGRIPHEPDVCPECGGRMRPDVILFGEMLPHGAFERAAAAALACEVFLIVGTSALVYPAAGLADVARRGGAAIVEINPEETPMTGICDFVIREKAGPALTALKTKIASRRP